MYLIEIKVPTKLKYLNAEDDDITQRLIRFGFMKNQKILVLKVNRGNYLVECMGTTYFINKRMASQIRVEQVNE